MGRIIHLPEVGRLMLGKAHLQAQHRKAGSCSRLGCFRGLETLRVDLPFRRLLAAGRRLVMFDALEVALPCGDQILVRTAPKQLWDTGPAIEPHPGGEHQTRLYPSHRYRTTEARGERVYGGVR